jgi:hypothetical protein
VTIRVEHRKQFAIIDSRTVNDPALSMRARGVLVWLLEKPDGWRVSAHAITRHCPEGRDAIRAALQELMDSGYLTRQKVQAENGQWTTESVVRERPLVEPDVPDSVPDDLVTGDGFPVVGFPATGDGFPVAGKPAVGFSGANTSKKNQYSVSIEKSPSTMTDDPKQKPTVLALRELPKSVDPESVKRLCIQLQQAIASHQPSGGKPKVTVAWVRAMGTLLNSGAKGWEDHKITEPEVSAMIEFVFSQLNKPDNGFCWANQVRSPDALRRHWMKMEQESKTRTPQVANGTVTENVGKLKEMLGS